ncbi:MAG TPA: alpha-amylase family glycosyl hydrolase [Anaerolineales bacterium]|nr:alpha-amylase family glycosyl hydrolase [Anaerolineales bacterium]
MKKQILVILALLLFSACQRPTATLAPAPTAPPTAEEPGLPAAAPTPADTEEPVDWRHVPSPKWEEQIIYFIMPDRFDDGDSSNNDQGAGEYDPADSRRYQGGDLAGITAHLDYIRGLGATAIWITPPVANQWWDPLVNYGGYHGYWAENFMAVDRHLGTLDEYQALSESLHQLGMFLIQDIVVNHTGNFFTYDGDFDPFDPVQNFILNLDSIPVTAPSQAPFDMNDLNNPEHAEAGIYHWTPRIGNFDNDTERRLYQLADLDDLNTRNPLVRDALRESFGFWIREVGVDGFRIDTIIYVEDEFWEDFHWSTDDAFPGVDLVAAQTGREGFFTFGEAFIGSGPMERSGDEEIAAYVGTDENPGMDAVINFPMYYTIRRVFGEGGATNDAAYRVNTALELYENPFIIPNFIDNHDVPRFLASGSLAGLQQAVQFMMTIPGVPVIYYGTEQAFDEQRAAMFAGGWGSGGEDHFDPDSPMYRHLAALSGIRLGNPLFIYGDFTELMTTADGPGVLAYSRALEGEQAIMIFNTADSPVIMTRLDTGLPAGTVLTNLYSLGNTDDLVVGAGGRITMPLAPREAMILMVSSETVEVSEIDAAVVFDPGIEGATFAEDFVVSGGMALPDTALLVIVDGDVTGAVEAVSEGDGRWAVTLAMTRFAAGVTEHSVFVYVPDAAYVSEALRFSTENPTYDVVVSVEDPADDFFGPEGAYILPADVSFGSQLDILAVELQAPGADLQITLTMAEITDIWGPVNGFDHVLFHVYVDLPDREGVTVLPRINAAAPEGFAWDVMAFVEGWNLAVYSSSGATAGEYGTALPAPISVVTDKDAGTVTITISGEALGDPSTYKGTKVYITTWDWDGTIGRYRPLEANAGPWTFGGGDGDVDPLIADEVGPVELVE